MPTTMRAATLLAPRAFEVHDVPLPEPGEGDVRIRLEGTGVCASNLPLWDGEPWFRYPLEPGSGGHEGWGIVERVGRGVPESLVGQRVTALSYRAYAEHDIARADRIVPLPPALDGLPFPGKALGSAMNVWKRAGIEAGQTVAIVGAGFLGAMLNQLASRAGARVVAIAQQPFAPDAARDARDHDGIVDAVRAMTQGRLCERVIEVVGWIGSPDARGTPGPRDLAAALTAEGGRLVLAAQQQGQEHPRGTEPWSWHTSRIDIIDARDDSPEVAVRGMREALHAVLERTIDPFPLFTHEYGLEELGLALDATRDPPAGFLKALVSTERARPRRSDDAKDRTRTKTLRRARGRVRRRRGGEFGDGEFGGSEFGGNEFDAATRSLEPTVISA